jgi:hypothetical protein
MPANHTNENQPKHVSFDKVDSTTSTASTISSLGDVTNKVFGILKSATNSRKNAHTSNRVVKFFQEEDDEVDDASNTSTASTEEHRVSRDFHSVEKDFESSPWEKTHESGGEMSVVECLAGDVVESYMHLRYYLRDISNSLERIDPNLSNNAELVSRLEDWEESWEVGRDYVHNSEMLGIVSELVSFLKKAEKLEPALAEMTQECGAEFCLCLPRLVWLHFLQDPERHMKLLQRFLPHHFAPNTESSEQLWDSTIEDLVRHYGEAEREVAHLTKRVADKGCSANRFLVQSVVAGPNSESQPDFAMELDLGPKSSANVFVHAIEERSMELQRHHPEEWNHFMMVIVRCFSEGKPKQRQRMGPKAPVPKLQQTQGRRSLWRNRPRLRTMPGPVACLQAILGEA